MAVVKEDILRDVRNGRLTASQVYLKELTHKHRLENVYLTAIQQITDDEFACEGYIPYSNMYLARMRTSVDDVTIAITEMGRQCGVALLHEYLGVGRDKAFVLERVDLERMPAAEAVDWLNTESVRIKVRILDREYNDDASLRSVYADFYFLVEDTVVYRQSIATSLQPVETYSRLRNISRRRMLKQAKDGAQVVGIKGVVLSGHEGEDVLSNLCLTGDNRFAALLQVDVGNLFSFDHKNDHLPGMLLLEGMRRLATDAAARMPVKLRQTPKVARLSVSFKSYAEFDFPVSLHADFDQSADGGPLQVKVKAVQLGRTVAESSLVVA